MAGDYGHVKVSRKAYAEDPFWNEPREFSRWEAWEDLIQTAAWRSHQRILDGTLVQLRRGQLLASERFLARRWQWSRSRVHRFLERLVRMERVTIDAGHAANHLGAIITLCNYDRYQTAPTGDRASDEPRASRLGEHAGPAANQKPDRRANHANGSTMPNRADARTGERTTGDADAGPRGAKQRTKGEGRHEEKAQERRLGAAGASRPGWSSRAVGIWIRRMGGTAPRGRIGHELKPLVDEHGVDDVLRWWDRYLELRIDEGEVQFANPNDFAQRFGAWKCQLQNGAARRTQIDDFDYSQPTENEEAVRWTA